MGETYVFSVKLKGEGQMRNDLMSHHHHHCHLVPLSSSEQGSNRRPNLWRPEFCSGPIRKPDFALSQSEARILLVANQSPGFFSGPIRGPDFALGQSESRILLWANQRPGFCSVPIRGPDFALDQSEA